MKRFLLFLFALTLLCPGVTARTDAYRTEKNIAYRDAAATAMPTRSAGSTFITRRMRRASRPSCGFTAAALTGGRREIPKALCEKGFAVVGVDYRLLPRVKVADCVEDAAAAAAWVVKNIASYGGDPKLVFIAGHSAGGYLTSMIGMDKRWMAPYGIDPDTAFAALIPYSGQVVTHFARRRELGIPDTQVVVDDMAPLNHVRPDCPPVLILSGDREREMLAVTRKMPISGA